jgi:hypothetical protein
LFRNFEQSISVLHVVAKCHDPVVVEAAALLLTRATHGSILKENLTSPPAIHSREVEAIIQLLLEALKLPFAKAGLLTLGLDFLFAIAHPFADTLLKSKATLRLLAGCLRGPLICHRMQALSAIHRLAEKISVQQDSVSPQHRLKLSEKEESECVDLLNSYGREYTDDSISIACSKMMQSGMFALAYSKERDYYNLGKRIASWIPLTEYSLNPGRYVDENGVDRSAQLGFTFSDWRDVAPICAKAIRDRGLADEQVLAEMLELKHLLVASGTNLHLIPELMAKAEKALLKHPNQAYFYYVRCYQDTASHSALSWAKKGLKCRDLTIWLQLALLERTLGPQFDLAQIHLQDSGRDRQTHELGSAFLQSAIEDSRRFIQISPPDNRHLKTMITWNIILTIAAQGKSLDPDLRELKVCHTRTSHTCFMIIVCYRTILIN